ncbi:MAG: GIY-YIG nuclease family protein [Gammaproteobacteria bacterium]|nr:GIY-YIG nuclease family protein [Gammaproteobacteria bacterium]
MEEKIPCVYILTNKPDGVLYIGVTTNLAQRTWQHRQKLVDGFSKKYNLRRLVWFERHESIVSAITREKQMKKWNRDWKIQLIEAANPAWNDLYNEIL